MSKVERGGGAVQWVTMTWKRSADFTAHLYLVPLTTLGGLYTLGEFTDPWAAAFSLAGGGAELQPADEPASKPLGGEGVD